MTLRDAPIPMAQAWQRLAELPLDWGVEEVALEHAAGRILAQDLRADRSFPPFHRVAMDGIAIMGVSLDKGDCVFHAAGIQAAGDPPLTLGDRGDAIEVMTGAVLPSGADTVIPVEELEQVADGIRLRAGARPRPGQNIHTAGSDAQAGALLLGPGAFLHGPALAVAASVGAASLWVRRRPRIAVLATGSELVDVGEQPAPHQIRVSNVTALCAGLQLDGHLPAWSGRCGDERDRLGGTIRDLLARHEVLVLSGGVSMGRCDHVPGLLAELGCRILFHGVRQRPGRPLLAALGPDGQLVTALPGNPVTAVIGLHRYLLPLLRLKEGRPDRVATVRLADTLPWGRPLALFLAATLDSSADGPSLAHPLPGGGSGDLSTLAASRGFLCLEEEGGRWEAGELVPFRPWSAS
ncbi:MAG: molybdopterin molybdotransferase MoeA [bacterium]|nr:molybdopterin molybdotransferase MoeA [bacterium]